MPVNDTTRQNKLAVAMTIADVEEHRLCRLVGGVQNGDGSSCSPCFSDLSKWCILLSVINAGDG
jgi:hypothetical protein